MPILRRAIAALLLAASMLLLAPVLRAQAPAACTGGTAACSVRVEPTLLRGMRLVRGTTGTDLGRASAWGGRDLTALLASSDSAVAHARHFTHAARGATALGVVAGGLLAAAAVVDLREREVTDAGLAYVAGASVAGLASLGLEMRAHRSLSRAVWWYNASVAR